MTNRPKQKENGADRCNSDQDDVSQSAHQLGPESCASYVYTGNCDRMKQIMKNTSARISKETFERESAACMKIIKQVIEIVERLMEPPSCSDDTPNNTFIPDFTAFNNFPNAANFKKYFKLHVENIERYLNNQNFYISRTFFRNEIGFHKPIFDLHILPINRTELKKVKIMELAAMHLQKLAKLHLDINRHYSAVGYAWLSLIIGNFMNTTYKVLGYQLLYHTIMVLVTECMNTCYALDHGSCSSCMPDCRLLIVGYRCFVESVIGYHLVFMNDWEYISDISYKDILFVFLVTLSNVETNVIDRKQKHRLYLSLHIAVKKKILDWDEDLELQESEMTLVDISLGACLHVFKTLNDNYLAADVTRTLINLTYLQMVANGTITSQQEHKKLFKCCQEAIDLLADPGYTENNTPEVLELLEEMIISTTVLRLTIIVRNIATRSVNDLMEDYEYILSLIMQTTKKSVTTEVLRSLASVTFIYLQNTFNGLWKFSMNRSRRICYTHALQSSQEVVRVTLRTGVLSPCQVMGLFLEFYRSFEQTVQDFREVNKHSQSKALLGLLPALLTIRQFREKKTQQTEAAYCTEKPKCNETSRSKTDLLSESNTAPQSKTYKNFVDVQAAVKETHAFENYSIQDCKLSFQDKVSVCDKMSLNDRVLTDDKVAVEKRVLRRKDSEKEDLLQSLITISQEKDDKNETDYLVDSAYNNEKIQIKNINRIESEPNVINNMETNLKINPGFSKLLSTKKYDFGNAVIASKETKSNKKLKSAEALTCLSRSALECNIADNENVCNVIHNTSSTNVNNEHVAIGISASNATADTLNVTKPIDNMGAKIFDKTCVSEEIHYETCSAPTTTMFSGIVAGSVPDDRVPAVELDFYSPLKQKSKTLINKNSYVTLNDFDPDYYDFTHDCSNSGDSGEIVGSTPYVCLAQLRSLSELKKLKDIYCFHEVCINVEEAFYDKIKEMCYGTTFVITDDYDLIKEKRIKSPKENSMFYYALPNGQVEESTLESTIKLLTDVAGALGISNEPYGSNPKYQVSQEDNQPFSDVHTLMELKQLVGRSSKKSSFAACFSGSNDARNSNADALFSSCTGALSHLMRELTVSHTRLWENMQRTEDQRRKDKGPINKGRNITAANPPFVERYDDKRRAENACRTMKKQQAPATIDGVAQILKFLYVDMNLKPTYFNK